MTFEEARAMYGSDEQMARDLFEKLAVAQLDLQLQQALRWRAEDRLECSSHRKKKYQDKDDKQ